jgi:NTE family protein
VPTFGSDRVADPTSPVRQIATDAEEDRPSPGIGLCLSGGGYRAMLFHLGGLWRLNEAGYLPRLARVSSVSGGSIVAGVLGQRWAELSFDTHGVAANFPAEIAGPLRRLASRTLDLWAVVLGLLLPGTTINERLARSYRRALFGKATLQELPAQPEFVFNATSLQSGDLWRFARAALADWRVGEVPHPDTELAAAVAASSAFPPMLSPAVLNVRAGAVKPGSGRELEKEPYTTRAVLADGGVYDNLGLETVWKKLDTVLVSDGGGHMLDEPRPGRLWPLQFLRVLEVIDNQVRALRKRQVISSLADGERAGAYWGIRSHVRDFGLAQPIADPPDADVIALAGVPTRLARIDDALQERLVNWGYLICDTALRRWLDPSQPRGDLPYAAVGLGTAGQSE